MFATVATAIEAGKIRVTPKTTFTPGVGAEIRYRRHPRCPSGELLVPPILGREQEGLVMHECTHAFFDLKKTVIKATEEEAVCYVVDALYFRMTGLGPARWSNEPHKTAKAVANSLLHQYAIGTKGIPAVDLTAWHGLVLAVALNPTYFARTAGIVKWFYGTDSYTNDGYEAIPGGLGRGSPSGRAKPCQLSRNAGILAAPLTKALAPTISIRHGLGNVPGRRWASVLPGLFAFRGKLSRHKRRHPPIAHRAFLAISFL